MSHTQKMSSSLVENYIQQLIDSVEMPVGIRPIVCFFPSTPPGLTVGIEIKAPGVPDDIAMINIYISNNTKRLERIKTIVNLQFSSQVVQGAVARILSPLKLSRDTRNWVRRHENNYHTKYSPNTPA